MEARQANVTKVQRLSGSRASLHEPTLPRTQSRQTFWHDANDFWHAAVNCREISNGSVGSRSEPRLSPKADPRKVSPGRCHIVAILLTEAVDQFLFFARRAYGEQTQHQNAGDSNGPVGRDQCCRCHHQCRGQIKWMADPLIRARCYQCRCGSCDNRVGQVLAKTRQRPPHQQRTERSGHDRSVPDLIWNLQPACLQCRRGNEISRCQQPER